MFSGLSCFIFGRKLFFGSKRLTSTRPRVEVCWRPPEPDCYGDNVLVTNYVSMALRAIIDNKQTRANQGISRIRSLTCYVLCIKVVKYNMYTPCVNKHKKLFSKLSAKKMYRIEFCENGEGEEAR